MQFMDDECVDCYLLVFKNSILFYGKKERGKEDFKHKKNEDTNYKNQNRKY